MPSSISALGHQNGCVTLWTPPNLPHLDIQLVAHLGLGVSLGVDPSQGGRYMSMAGRDGTVKVWDCRNWMGAAREGVRGEGVQSWSGVLKGHWLSLPEVASM